MKEFIEKLRTLFEKRYSFPTAEEAYYTTMYGTQITMDEEVEIHKCQVSSLIRSKMRPEYDEHLKAQFASSYCVYDIPDDVSHRAGEIFMPFVEKGYMVKCISPAIPEIKSRHLYLIAWDSPTPKNTENETEKQQ